MRQNRYDDPEFFAAYSRMPRSIEGLESAFEWPAFRSLLPELRGKRLLDLGCGFGWHCRYARQEGAASVVGVDISANMLARARETTDDPAIEYHQSAIEDIDIPHHEFDLVISSLALHYVQRFDIVCQKVHQCLIGGGKFVISVEHPMFTANAAQDWCYGPEGQRLHWPLDNYLLEGARHTNWLAENVIKYHRTVTTYVNSLIDCGFDIERVIEPGPSAEMLLDQPALKDESRRCIFLLIAAVSR